MDTGVTIETTGRPASQIPFICSTTRFGTTSFVTGGDTVVAKRIFLGSAGID
jgi:hypothetical protein